MGNVYIRGSITGSGGLDAVDSDLVASIYAAAERSPYDVEIFSGYRDSPDSRHGAGQALDVALIDPATGQYVPNLGAGGEAFAIYEEFARLAREEQQRIAPDRSDDFRWGGYFGPSALNPRGADLMHFDFRPGGAVVIETDTGELRGAAMARGTWEHGLNASGAAATGNLGPGLYYNWAQRDVPAPAGADWPNLWDTSALVLYPGGDNSRARVALLQSFLNTQVAGLAVTGRFDAATEAAVREYQQAAGIPPHGLVGTATIRSMFDTWRTPIPTPRPEPAPPPLSTPNPLRSSPSTVRPSAGFAPAVPGFGAPPVPTPQSGFAPAVPGFGMSPAMAQSPLAQYGGALPARPTIPAAYPPMIATGQRLPSFGDFGAGGAATMAMATVPPALPDIATMMAALAPAKPPRGPLDIEAIDEQKRNAALKAELTAAALRNADSRIPAKSAAQPEEDPDAPKRIRVAMPA